MLYDIGLSVRYFDTKTSQVQRRNSMPYNLPDHVKITFSMLDSEGKEQIKQLGFVKIENGSIPRDFFIKAVLQNANLFQQAMAVVLNTDERNA